MTRNERNSSNVQGLFRFQVAITFTTRGKSRFAAVRSCIRTTATWSAVPESSWTTAPVSACGDLSLTLAKVYIVYYRCFL